MADDDDINAWDDTLEEKQAPQIGANKEMLRKAMALNPALRAEGIDSTMLLDRLQAAKSGKPLPTAAKPAAGAPAAPGRTLTDVVRELKAELDAKSRAIAAERAALDQREKALRPELCTRFIDAVLAVDPNMTSPKTAYLVTHEKAFLDAVGFTPQKLVERESRKK